MDSVPDASVEAIPTIESMPTNKSCVGNPQQITTSNKAVHCWFRLEFSGVIRTVSGKN